MRSWGGRVGPTGQLGLCGSLGLADSSQITTSVGRLSIHTHKGAGHNEGCFETPILPLEC